MTGSTGFRVLALDVGGTKISAAVVDADGTVEHGRRVPTPPEGGDALTAVVVELAESQARAVPSLAGVGVSVAGAVADDDSTVTFAPNLPGWNGLALGDLLAERLGTTARVTYDGHAGALGEHWQGAGRGSPGMAFVIVGTGVGGGLILDGVLHRGVHGLGGAAGWMLADPEQATQTAAARQGGLEAVASGPSLVDTARDAGMRQVTSPQDLVRLADRGDPTACRVIDRAAQRTAYAVVSMVNLLDLDTVVFGGGVGTGVAAFVEHARSALDSLAHPVFRGSVRVVPAMLGGDAFLLGAASRVFRALGRA